MLKRNENKRIDPGKVNGVGGRVEPDENFLQAAIRETKEETGYELEESDFQLFGIGHLEGGYTYDWMVAFFIAEVQTKKDQHEQITDDGKLLWLSKDEILNGKYELVDDLNYIFKYIEDKETFFFRAEVTKNERISFISINWID